MYHSLTRTSLSEAVLMSKVGHTQGRWEQCLTLICSAP